VKTIIAIVAPVLFVTATFFALAHTAVARAIAPQ
jgi:hypothetical protein